MEIVIIIGGIIVIVILYFSLGMFVKFFWCWLPLFLGLLIGVSIGLSGGWWRAAIGVFTFFLSLLITDAWHRTTFYLRIEAMIDKAFYFDD